MDAAELRCKNADITLTRKSLEGKNYKALVEDINGYKYDMVIHGAFGLGTVKENLLGSVCERVVRRVNSDLCIIKQQSTAKKDRLAIKKGFSG